MPLYSKYYTFHILFTYSSMIQFQFRLNVPSIHFNIPSTYSRSLNFFPFLLNLGPKFVTRIHHWLNPYDGQRGDCLRGDLHLWVNYCLPSPQQLLLSGTPLHNYGTSHFFMGGLRQIPLGHVQVRHVTVITRG